MYNINLSNCSDYPIVTIIIRAFVKSIQNFDIKKLKQKNPTLAYTWIN